jgi:multidrug efflux pump subunit AcrA (membrane-fusion protein)
VQAPETQAPGRVVRSRRLSPLSKDSTNVQASNFVPLLIAATVTGCDKPVPATSQARPVPVAVERRAEGETVSLTGHVRAKDQANLAFRLDGHMIERLVTVGDVVTAGQVVAKLDPQVQQSALRSAEGNWWLEATRRPGPLRWPRSAISDPSALVGAWRRSCHSDPAL